MEGNIISVQLISKDDNQSGSLPAFSNITQSVLIKVNRHKMKLMSRLHM